MERWKVKNAFRLFFLIEGARVLEEMILKGFGEFGFPTAVAIFLLWKGTASLNRLTDAIKELIETVKRNDTRFDRIERDLSEIKSDVKTLSASVNIRWINSDGIKPDGKMER